MGHQARCYATNISCPQQHTSSSSSSSSAASAPDGPAHGLIGHPHKAHGHLINALGRLACPSLSFVDGASQLSKGGSSAGSIQRLILQQQQQQQSCHANLSTRG
jgi:hypothetical protein